MLASVPEGEPLAVRDPAVAEVAAACTRLRRKLERELLNLEDEVGKGFRVVELSTPRVERDALLE